MTTTAKPVIFLATANDRDDRARYLRNLAEEARQVRRALAAAETRGHCELLLRQNATAGDILDVFQDVRYRNRVAIFHFGGHADGYRLLLETAAGQPAAADAGGLARFLAQQRGLALVFLNGCSTAGQVSDLLDAGVQAVIATDQAVEDSMATAFAARFYQGLAGGAAIGPAFEQARAAMAMQGGAAFRHLGAAEEEDGDRIPWQLHYRAAAQAAATWSLPQAAADPLFGLPDLPPLDLPDKPYRYLGWYRRADAAVFFGRGREIRELYHRVTAPDSPPIVLLYGQSGVGKSSLLAAGLLPRLEASHAVRYVRRDQALGLAGTLAAALGASPDADLAGVWRGLEAQTGRPLLVILDQVEELFTRPNREQPDEMTGFLAAAAALLGEPARRPQGRLVLSFRKEWLAEIKARLAERSLPRTKVFLERLDREGVIEVVTGPQRTERLRAQYGLEIGDPLLPGQIADDLLADRESPVAPMLAILLTDLWDAARARSYDRPTFDADLYHEFRSRGLKLDDFLSRQLQTLRDKLPDAVDSGLALDLLAHHTTPLGTAEQRTLAELEQTYRHRQDVLPALLQACRDLYLLVDPSRNQPDQPPASRLTHDTLAPHVRRRFEESDAPGQRARRILENRKTDWIDGKAGTPLEGMDLHTVEVGLPGARCLSQDEDRLMSASREAAARKRRNQAAVRATLVGLLLIVVAIAARATLYPALLRLVARQTGPVVFMSDLGLGIEAFEVTNQRYQWCSVAGKCPEPLVKLSSFYDSGKARYPVTGVDAWQAAIFCKWIGRRLPTLAQWERATEPGRLPWNDQGPGPGQANLCFDCEDSTGAAQEVGSHPTGAIGGVHDMIGNVSEWTRTEMDDNMQPGEDWSGENHQTMPNQVAIVGGSFRSTPNEQLYMNRASGVPKEDIGFRCVEP